MNYLPKPRNALPGIDIPLQREVPLHSRPVHLWITDNTRRWHQDDCVEFQAPEKSSDTQWVPEDTQAQVDFFGEKIYLISHKCADTGSPKRRLPPKLPATADDSDAGVELLTYWHRFPLLYNLIGRLAPLNQSGLLQLAAILQSWAFFGLLELLFSETMVRDEWSIRSSDQSPEVEACSVYWPQRYIDRLHTVLSKGIEAPVLLAAKRAERFCRLVDRNDDLNRVSPVAQVVLSIRVLCEVISYQTGGLGSPATWVTNRYLMDIAQQRGWCSNVFRRMSYSHALSGTYYLMLLQMKRSSSEDHTRCRLTPNKCVAQNTIMDAGYQTRHVSKNCQCDHIGVSTTSLVDCIAEGQIPLIRISATGDDISLSIEHGHPNQHYVAISHVWSDGLGNPIRNALPRCQLKYLLRLTQQVPQLDIRTIIPGLLKFDVSSLHFVRPSTSSVLLWMDTLCIPVSGNEENDTINDAKLRAISRMNSVYACAYGVMVLDQEMRTTSLSASSELELYARITTSPWSSRAWTFQEGASTSKCHFAFEDVIVSPHIVDTVFKTNVLASHEEAGLITPIDAANARSHYERTWRPPWLRDGRTVHDHSQESSKVEKKSKSIISQDLYSHFWGWVSFQMHNSYPLTALRPQDEPLQRFVMAWNALSYRASTFDSDIDLIFANLLNIDPAELPAPPQRLQAILWHLDILPVGLLFAPGPRLHEQLHHRNRWVPTSMSGNPISLLQPASVAGSSDSYISSMRLSADTLWLQAEAAPTSMLLLINIHVERCEEMFVQARCNESTYIRITAVTTAHDKFEHSEDEQMCLLLEHSIPSTIWTSHGVRLFVSATQANEAAEKQPAESAWMGVDARHFWASRPLGASGMTMSAIYDCPVLADAHVIHENDLPKHAVIVKAQDMTTMTYPDAAWKLKIQCDGMKSFERQERRGVHGRSVPESLIKFITSPAVICFLVIWLSSSVPMRIIIASQLGWMSTNILYKLSTILFAWRPFHMMISHRFPFIPLSEILFIASRITDKQVREIDIAYTIVSIPLMTLAWLYFPAHYRTYFGPSLRSVERAAAFCDMSAVSPKVKVKIQRKLRSQRAQERMVRRVEHWIMQPYDICLAIWRRLVSKDNQRAGLSCGEHSH